MTNWIKIYEGIDPYEPQKYGVRIAPEDSDQRQEAREEDAHRLTVQYLQVFKRETEGLTKAELIDYIDGMNLQPPKPSFEAFPKPYINSAIFKARRNYFLFVQEYRKQLEDPKDTTGKPELKVNSIALVCLAMTKAGLKPELTETKSAEVAAKFGFLSLTSGRNLKNKYNDLRDGQIPSKIPKRLETYFNEAAMILKSKPKALEALNTLKTEFQQRHGF